MLAADLVTMFRNETMDVERPYLWSDAEVYMYLMDAYRMFARLTGGIPDVSSSITEIDVSAGDSQIAISPLVTRVVRAFRGSDGKEIDVINHTDVPLRRNSATGQIELLKGNTKCWVLSFTGGSGVVPAEGTVISNGTASARLIGVWGSTGVQVLSGANMPSTGKIRVRTPTTGSFAAAVLTGITATSTDVGRSGFTEEGLVEYVVLGGERLLAQLIPASSESESITMHIRRLPIQSILTEGDAIDDVGEEHQLHFIKWMKSLAYRKQDSETFDAEKALQNEGSFMEYCDQSSYENDQYKRKTRYALRSRQDGVNPKRILSDSRRDGVFDKRKNNGG